MFVTIVELLLFDINIQVFKLVEPLIFLYCATTPVSIYLTVEMLCIFDVRVLSGRQCKSTDWHFLNQIIFLDQFDSDLILDC